MCAHNWQEAYVAWRKNLLNPQPENSIDGKTKPIVPNALQQQVLDAVHRRCVYEATGNMEYASNPFLRLVHGLPGSGKSKLLSWLRSYYEEVWQWSEGREFVFLAPLNSMACNVGGSTVHGWGRIAFQDKRGIRILPRDTTDDSEVSALTMKCGALRWLWIDEIEATGADIIGQLEHNVRFHVSSKNKFKYDTAGMIRVFGGVNTMFMGDFWQLRPTGQIALMSNPFATKAKENQKARQIMAMFWDPDISYSLQTWTGQERMLHLNINERSGGDKWFSEVLNSCRDGSLCEDDYNFLHGYPTLQRIDFWYHLREHNNGSHSLPLCEYKPYDVQEPVQTFL